MSSSARSRSDVSRESLACTSGGLSLGGGGGGRKRGRDDDEDIDGRTASSRVIEVNGSWANLRDSSRLLKQPGQILLQIITSRVTVSRPRFLRADFLCAQSTKV